MRNHTAPLTLDAEGIASFRNWQRIIGAQYSKRQAEMQRTWDHAQSIQQWQQGGRMPVYGPKAPLPLPQLPKCLDLDVSGGMTVGFHKANMPFGSDTFNMVSHMFGGTSQFAILPERLLAIADVERLCDVLSGPLAAAVAAAQQQAAVQQNVTPMKKDLEPGTALAFFADTDVDQAALCVDVLLDDDALRLVLPTIISAAGNYASACDDLDFALPL
jgi:hypothetical protein